MPLYAIVIAATISVALLAFVLSRIMMRRQRGATPPGVYEDEARIDEEGHSIRDALRFMVGPFPLSVALHVLLLLILIATIKVQSAHDLLMVTLQQVGGGGGSKHDEMRDVDMPEMTMPDTMPQMVVPKVAPQISRTTGAADAHLRTRRVRGWNRDGRRQRDRLGFRTGDGHRLWRLHRRAPAQGTRHRAGDRRHRHDGFDHQRRARPDGRTSDGDSSAGSDRASRNRSFRRPQRTRGHRAADYFEPSAGDLSERHRRQGTRGRKATFTPRA